MEKLAHTFQVRLQSVGAPLHGLAAPCGEFCGVLFPTLFSGPLKALCGRSRRGTCRLCFLRSRGRKRGCRQLSLGKPATERRHIYQKHHIAKKAANWLTLFDRQNGQSPNVISVFQSVVVFSFRKAWVIVFMILFYLEGLLSVLFSLHEKERKQVTEWSCDGFKAVGWGCLLNTNRYSRRFRGRLWKSG